MPRVVGVDIPKRKRLVVSLTYIKGLGPFRALEVCDKLGLDPHAHAEKLSSVQVGQLNDLLQSGEYLIEGHLRRDMKKNIDRLVAIRSYRGRRHQAGLPVRGQRTSTNARTRKGPKKTVAGKKKAV